LTSEGVAKVQLVVKTQPFLIDGQRRVGGMRHPRLEGWFSDRNHDLDRRATYQNNSSEDLVLRGQEETKL
jgi:hypothetical protein